MKLYAPKFSPLIVTVPDPERSVFFGAGALNTGAAPVHPKAPMQAASPTAYSERSAHTIEGEHARSLRPHHSTHSHLRVRCAQRRRCAEQALCCCRRRPGCRATFSLHNRMSCRCGVIHTKSQAQDRHCRTTRCRCIDRDLVAHHRCCTTHLDQSLPTDHTCHSSCPTRAIHPTKARVVSGTPRLCCLTTLSSRRPCSAPHLPVYSLHGPYHQR